MKKNDNHIDIQTIEAYLKGQLPPEEMQRINSLRSIDPFLDKALEGYENSAESLDGFSRLQKRFDKSRGWWNSGKWIIGTGILVLLVLLGTRIFKDSTTSSIPVNDLVEDTSFRASPVPENTSLNSNSIIRKDSLRKPNNIPPYSEKIRDRVVQSPTTDVLFVNSDIDTVKKVSSTTPTIKRDTLLNNATTANKFSGMEDILVLKYLNEFILKSYLASKVNDPKSKSKKGKEELQALNNNLVQGNYKKAVEMIEVNKQFSVEHKEALYKLIKVHELAKKHQNQEAYYLLERITTWHPSIFDDYRKLVQEFPK